MANETLNDAVEDDAVVIVIERQENEAVHRTRCLDGVEGNDQSAHRGFHGGRITLGDVDSHFGLRRELLALGGGSVERGKVVDMVKTLSADYSEPMSSPESTNEESTTLIDLDAIERDLADVEMALSRLDAGTYWVDEISGQPLPDAVLEANPLARRNPA